MSEGIQFTAFLPASVTAIQRSGAGDGMRVRLDIPETEVGNALRILGWTGRPLRVTIEPLKKNGEA